DDDFFDDASLLGNNGLFRGFGHVDRGVSRAEIGIGSGAIGRAALHSDTLLAEGDVLVHWLFFHVLINAHAATLHGALADFYFLFDNGDDLQFAVSTGALRSGFRGAGASGVIFGDIPRTLPLQNVGGAISLLFVGSVHNHNGAPLAQLIGVIGLMGVEAAVAGWFGSR